MNDKIYVTQEKISGVIMNVHDVLDHAIFDLLLDDNDYDSIEVDYQIFEMEIGKPLSKKQVDIKQHIEDEGLEFLLNMRED